MYNCCYNTFMVKKPASAKRVGTGSVREPVQVYLTADDAQMLTRLAADTGLSKAEVLRQGLRSYARAHGQSGQSPMLRFIADSPATGWPKDVAADLDKALAAAYKGVSKKGR